MTARSAYIQLQNITRDVKRTSRPRLPPLTGFDGHDDYMRQVELWKKWIQWEIDDNLVLKDEDIVAYRTRVLFTYRQALMALQFWPHLWYDAAEFCFANGLDHDGTKFLNQAVTANPESCLLSFKLADRIEMTTSNDETSDPGAKQRMKKVRDPYDRVLNALYDLVTKIRAREALDIQKIESSQPEADRGTNALPGQGEEDTAPNADAAKPEYQAQIDAVQKMAQAQEDLVRKTISFTWVALMRATRRIQGKGVPGEKGPGGFRIVFGDARKRGKLTSEFYAESALIEYYCYRDPAGTKIFERGMKLFPDDAPFTLEYLKHLVAINDITSK